MITFFRYFMFTRRMIPKERKWRTVCALCGAGKGFLPFGMLYAE